MLQKVIYNVFISTATTLVFIVKCSTISIIPYKVYDIDKTNT